LSNDVGWNESVAASENRSGVRLFDRLAPLQKQVAILAVASAALDPDFPMPEPTAVLDGTVTAIYRRLQELLEFEIAVKGTTSLRKAVLEALDEFGYWEELKSEYEEEIKSGYKAGEEPRPPLSVDSNDLEEWRILAESLGRELVNSDYHLDSKLF